MATATEQLKKTLARNMALLDFTNVYNQASSAAAGISSAEVPIVPVATNTAAKDAPLTSSTSSTAALAKDV